MTPEQRAQILIPFLSSILLILALFSTLWEIEEGAGLGLLYALRGVRPPPGQVVIIALDAASAVRLGQSERPERWSRALHARLIDGLAERGAVVIGFDILFERARDPSDDLRLASALRRAGNVLLVEQVVRESVRTSDGRTLASIDRRIRALPMFLAAAAGSAPFVMPKAVDGVFEFWLHLSTAGDTPSLPVLMARVMGVEGSRHRAGPEHSRQLLSLYGPIGTVRTYAYDRALELIADPVAGRQAFAGKAVLIGFSETNQSRQLDAYRTPYTNAEGLDLSGVELCATALANIIDDQRLDRPDEGKVWPGLVFWALILSWPWLRFPARQALLITALLSVMALAVCAGTFSWYGIWLPVLLLCFLAPALSTVTGIAFQLLVARRREQQLSQAVALGLTHKGSTVLAKLLAGCQSGRIVHSVCLCSDIVGYTACVESLSPKEANSLLNSYFSRFIPLIEAHGGHVMDIVGDAVLSIWLADDGAHDACRRARAAVMTLDQTMNVAGCEDGVLPTRFGLHYGQVFLGELGHTHHREIRVVGNIVNTASRIQGANKALGTRILASAETMPENGPGHARALGRFLLVGKTLPVTLYEISPVALAGELSGQFAKGVAMYAAGEYDRASHLFMTVLAQCPDDGPTQFFLARCRAGGERDDHAADGAISLSSK